MSKSFAKKLYKSKEWQTVRQIVILNQHGICNRCDNPVYEVHHKIYLTAENINDPNITLDTDNLEGLCRDCHMREHDVFAGNSEYTFDDEGNPIKRREMEKYNV